MTAKAIHGAAGLFLIAFTGLHLFNHIWSISGAEEHIALMNVLRKLYRNTFAEILLLASIAIQLTSGVKLFIASRKNVKSRFERLQLWTGLYLLFFLFVHVTAVFAARLMLDLDTNFYFGVAGINIFPFNLFFIPYYAIAVISFFGHMAAIHARKMSGLVLGLTPVNQAKMIVVLGCIITVLLFYGFTDHFTGLEIPRPYSTLFR